MLRRRNRFLPPTFFLEINTALPLHPRNPREAFFLGLARRRLFMSRQTRFKEFYGSFAKPFFIGSLVFSGAFRFPFNPRVL